MIMNIISKKIWPIRAKDFSFVMVENYKAPRTEDLNKNYSCKFMH